MFGKKVKTLQMTIDDMEDRFDELGKDGWELCSTVPLIIKSNWGSGSDTKLVYFIFKKPLK
jgi:hypothetical protein